MSVIHQILRFAVVGVVLTLAACGGGGDDGGGGGTPPAGILVGAAGGTVVGPNGTKVVIPPGALAADTTINIEESSAGAPALPPGLTVRGPMYAFTPHGTTFAVPVTLTLPFDGSAIPSGSGPAFYKTNAQNQWERVTTATFGASTVTAQITSFSNGQSGIELIECPLRQWSFQTTTNVPSWGTPIEPSRFDAKRCGEVLETFLFGALDSVFELDHGLTPNLAMGEVYSDPDGLEFSVYAEAPSGVPTISGFRSGGEVTLEQSQSYVKRSPNATLQLELSQAFLQARDHNGRPLSIECPPGIRIENKSDEDLVSLCHPLSTRIEFRAAVYRGVRSPTRRGLDIFTTHGVAEMYGFDGKWKFFATPMGDADTPLWTNANFTVTDDVGVTDPKGLDGRDPLVVLNAPLVLNIDLSSIDVCEQDKKADECVDKAFTVLSILKADAWNWRGRESGAAAFLRDPQHIGNHTLRVTGLEATNNPQPLPTEQPEPIACSTGPDPAAGVLQFSAGSYSAMEGTGTRGGARDILVTRTQGSKGAVSVNFSAGGGTAVSGVDYDAPAITVRFSDGDTTPRLVTINVLSNTAIEADKTLNLTLTNPGGCATLGQQAGAVLTILDDDQPPPPPPPSGLDLTFGGGDGKATLERFGGARSGMALQADGKIVMVGGTFTDFILARFNADGSIDTGFGIDGKVTTDMGSGLRQEEALAVAIQSDGKIVVAGHTAIDNTPPSPDPSPTFALARYNSDGSLDTSFGTGGRVSNNVNGQAYAVAIQADGKIVAAGEFSFASTNGSDFSDFTVARFNANGTLDLAFGGSGTGQVATDIGSATNTARNLVLQPNGAIVVSGKPQGSQAGFDHTDVARYNANGTLDTSFGSGGKLTLAGVDVGQGLARQPDGRFVLVGTTTVGTFPTSSARFALMRLNADGSPDASFGTAGTVNTAFTFNAGALAVALQGDGKIVAAGSTVLEVQPNFVVARYNGDGSLDTTLGNGTGNLSIDFFGFSDGAQSVAVQADGKIVVGGVATNNFSGYGVARINP
jgi:uncharacterized delta-60 repeat protein